MAAYWLDEAAASGVAGDVATDVQGYQPPSTIIGDLKCRSGHRTGRAGISHIAIDQTVTFQKHQSYLFGKKDGLKFSSHRNDLEFIQSDKLDFMDEVWHRPDADGVIAYKNV